MISSRMPASAMITISGSGRQEAYDLVVASAGGYPKDINYIQAHKSIHNAASFVKDGGMPGDLCRMQGWHGQQGIHGPVQARGD